MTALNNTTTNPKAPAPRTHDTLVFLASTIGVLLMVAMAVFIIQNQEPELSEDQKVLNQAQSLMLEADRYRLQWNKAEKAGDDADRQKFMKLTHKKCEEVIELVDTLRREPYVDKEEMFKPGYEHIEKLQVQAGQVIHDIVRRSRWSDWEAQAEKPQTPKVAAKQGQ